MLLSESFDDDPVGAVPDNLTGSSVITTGVGYLLGVKTHPAASIKVASAIGGDMVGKVLRLSDSSVPNGAGHAELIGLPAGQIGPGIVRTTFRLRCGKFYGDEFEMAMIDNRATPGTGRLAALAIDSAGTLKLNGNPTGKTIIPGVTYLFSVEVNIVAVGPDTWKLRITNVSQPDDTGSWGPLPSQVDGTQLSSIWFSTSDSGWGTYDLDEIAIVGD